MALRARLRSTPPNPHGEEAPTGPRKARPDDRLRAVSNHEAPLSPVAILRDARPGRAPQDEVGIRGRLDYGLFLATASPSSFTNDATGLSRSSSTSSDGRHSRTPFAVTTIGRLIRIGCASMKSISSSSLH